MKEDIICNYHSLINRGYHYFENSTIMLLNLLKRLNPSSITIAGFDGFSKETKQNYADESFQNDRHANEFDELNKEIEKMFGEIVETMTPACKFNLLTPSLYANVLERVNK